jgi:SP family arabinose:H+ symporter-like MFS transporter
MGPIPWIIISEIFPARIRGRAASVGVFTIWVACYIVAQTFPVLKETAGGAITFWIYGGCSLASFLFVLCMLPETKGRTLEEIEASWKNH